MVKKKEWPSFCGADLVNRKAGEKVKVDSLKGNEVGARCLPSKNLNIQEQVDRKNLVITAVWKGGLKGKRGLDKGKTATLDKSKKDWFRRNT